MCREKRQDRKEQRTGFGGGYNERDDDELNKYKSSRFVDGCVHGWRGVQKSCASLSFAWQEVAVFRAPFFFRVVRVRTAHVDAALCVRVW